ncbi:type II toxin-antitoxin system Phd/YefM family antitoxin [Legionella pneumophila]
MQTASYTYLREHLSEIMKKIANGEQVCIVRKGKESFIIAKVGVPTETQLNEKKHDCARSIKKLKKSLQLLFSL